MTRMQQADPNLLLIVIFGAIALIIVIVAVRLSRRQAAARTEALRRQSLLMGYSFAGKAVKANESDSSLIDPLLAAALQKLRMLRKGSSRKIGNLLAKSEDRGGAHWIFDYSYATGAGNSRHTVRQTVMGSHFPDYELPRFTLGPEGLIARLFDGADVDFDQDPEFSKRYLLKGDDVQPVKRLFSPYVRSMLMEKKNWVIESTGHYVFGCRQGHLVDPEELLQAQGEFRRLVDALNAESDRAS